LCEKSSGDIGQILCSVVIFLHEKRNYSDWFSDPCTVARSFREDSLFCSSIRLALVTGDVGSVQFKTIHSAEVVPLNSIALTAVIVKTVPDTGEDIGSLGSSVEFKLYPTWPMGHTAGAFS
jgi:hypothetical protein